jgi:hypothetical protein
LLNGGHVHPRFLVGMLGGHLRAARVFINQISMFRPTVVSSGVEVDLPPSHAWEIVNTIDNVDTSRM